MIYSVQASLIPELFGTRLRYTGASLGYQLASPFAGGLAPIIAASGTSSGQGLYLLGRDGAVYAWGDASYAGRVVHSE